jgi:acyl-CoA thioesterase
MYLVSAAVHPHISQGKHYELVASLDNSIWFHNYDFKADDENNWLLYEVQSPAAGLY